jgi:hypothetical protein
MSLIKNYFNKDNIASIRYEDVAHFFSEAKQESDKIEFKSFVEDEKQNQGSRESSIHRTICGFLNSEGGIIIWGAPKGKLIEDKKEKIFEGELSMVEISYEKDSFISKITDSITPAPRGILFHRIDFNKKHIYIFEIPKSEYSPHQFKNTYYMRIDGQTKPAPHHYVEALMRKITFPHIEGYISISTSKDFEGKFQLYIFVWFFNLSKFQNDYNLWYRLITTNGKFQGWNAMIQNPGVKILKQGQERRVKNLQEVIHNGGPMQDNAMIEFPLSHQKIYETELNLQFGAKLSPMKVSHYKIKCGSQENQQDFIISKTENQYMFEAKEALGISERESIMKIIGRI